MKVRGRARYCDCGCRIAGLTHVSRAASQCWRCRENELLRRRRQGERIKRLTMALERDVIWTEQHPDVVLYHYEREKRRRA